MSGKIKAVVFGILAAGMTAVLPLVFGVFKDGHVGAGEASALVGAFLAAAAAYLQGLHTEVPK